jgi:hypothetical protein
LLFMASVVWGGESLFCLEAIDEGLKGPLTGVPVGAAARVPSTASFEWPSPFLSWRPRPRTRILLQSKLRRHLILVGFFISSDPYSIDTDPDPIQHFRLSTDPDPGFL